jgi:Outer membrane protein beta-barrel domain
VFRTLLIVTTIVACASIAAAQDDYKKFEFFGGYSHNLVNTDSFDEREGFPGFEAAATANLSRYVGLKFDFSAHFKDRSIPLFTIQGASGSLDIDSQVYNFLGGVQLKDNSTDSTLKPFAHALVGAAHARNKLDFNSVGCIAVFPSPCVNQTVSETGFAGAFGGGLDIRVSDGIDLRVIQVDYNPTRLFDSTQHNFRIGAGIVFH